MMKRILILGLILSGMILISSFQVSAADEEQTFEDPEDDVIDYVASIEEEVYTSEKPNLDITKIEYSKTGKEITMTLEVKGKIEDKGDLDEIESLDLVSYLLVLYTTGGDYENTYEIIYVNEECLLNEETKDISWKKVGNSILEYTFDLENIEENFFALEAATFEYSGMSIYADEFFEESGTPIAVTGGPYEGDVGENISFLGYAFGGTEPYTYSWNFGDGTTSSQQDPVHTYDSKGKYTVTLTVTDDDGLVDSETTVATIGGGSNQNNNDNKDDGDSSLYIFIALIAIVVVVGVVVVVIVIRR